MKCKFKLETFPGPVVQRDDNPVKILPVSSFIFCGSDQTSRAHAHLANALRDMHCLLAAVNANPRSSMNPAGNAPPQAPARTAHAQQRPTHWGNRAPLPSRGPPRAPRHGLLASSRTQPNVLLCHSEVPKRESVGYFLLVAPAP